MTTLADEIAAAVPALMQEYPDGPTAPKLARYLACDEDAVRATLTEVRDAGLVSVFRYRHNGPRHLVPLGYDFGFSLGAGICKNCEIAFERKRKGDKSLCCSKSCGVTVSWRDPSVHKKRVDAITEDKKRPERQAILAAHNECRWSKVDERKKLSEQNRREWADPGKKARRSVSIQAKQGTADKREFYSKRRKEDWQNPEYRNKVYAAATAAQQKPENRARYSQIMRDKWADPVMRAKLTANNERLSAERARRQRERMAALTPEEKAARYAKMRETKRKNSEARRKP